MKTPSAARRRGKPVAAWNGAAFEVAKGDRRLLVKAEKQEGEAQLLVELDSLTHWSSEGNPEPQESDELSIEDLHAILEAIEEEADEQGLSIDFE
ncbi:MAG: hypothetical protein K2X62_12640 [Beijerinckiaceae bacterium]|jgi:hypothetical protein|nr:hypothetical protein [Beijerinckiaceae bacterium]